MSDRAYPAQSQRQQNADRLVWSEEDFRNVLNEARRTRSVATIRLAGDVVLSRPVELAAASYAVVIDGGGRYKFLCADVWTWDYIFNVEDRAVSDIEFRGVTFACPATQSGVVQRVVRGIAGALLTRVHFRSCRVLFAMALFSAYGDPISWADSVADDISFIGGNSVLSATIGFAVFTRCLIGRASRKENSNPTVGNIDAVEISGSSANVRYVGATPFFSTLFAGGVVVPPTFVTLNTAAPTLVVGAASLIDITVGAGCSGNLLLGSGLQDGQMLVLRILGVTAPGAFTLPNNPTNNVRLSAAWAPTVRQTLSLIWAAGIADWEETARSNNA